MIQNINLYIFKPVLVTLRDGGKKQGTLVFIKDDSIILNSDNEDVAFTYADIADIEYVDKVTDYHTYKGYGEIGAYRYLPEDAVSEAYKAYFMNNEYDCVAACHLYMQAADGNKTFAKDLRPIQWSHAMHISTLQKECHIYIYHDGTVAVGTLVSEPPRTLLRLPDHTHVELAKEGLEKILPLPKTDEFVIAVKKDGTVIQGNYNGIFQKTIALRVSEGAELIDLSLLKTLRFRGIICAPDQTYSKNSTIRRKDDPAGISYVLKTPLLSSSVDSGLLKAGRTVEFEPSMIARYPIAKDIVVEDLPEKTDQMNPTDSNAEETESGEYTGKGVIINFRANPSEFGNIGDNFIVYPFDEVIPDAFEKHPGIVTYSSGLIDFQYDTTQIYVVEYTCAAQPEPGKRQPVSSVKLLQSFPKRDYAYVSVDSEGIVHAIPVETAYLRIAARKNANRKPNVEVEILCEDGALYHGFIDDCTDEKVVLQCNFTLTEIALECVREVRYYSLVTSNRVDMLRVSFPFAPLVIHINDILAEDDKALLSADLAGWIVSYRLKHNYHKGQLISKGLMGIEGKLYQVRKMDGRLCLFDHDKCVIVERDLSRGEESYHLFQSPLLSLNAAYSIKQIESYKAYDYPAACSTRIHGKEIQVFISYVDASPMRQIQKKLNVGYLCGKENGACLLQASNDAQPCVYPVLYESASIKDHKQDFANFDWRVTYLIGISQGARGTLLLDINSFSKRKKEVKKGYLIEYADEMCTVIPEEEYGGFHLEKPAPIMLLFANRGTGKKLSEIDTVQRDYEIRYLPCEKNGQEGIALMAIDTGRPKQKYGYVVTYLPAKSCGFITDKDDLAYKLNNPFARSGSDRHFYITAIRGIAPEDIKTPACYYEVVYTLGANNKVISVNFIRSIRRENDASPGRSANAPTSMASLPFKTQPDPAEAAKPVLREEETVPLDVLLEKNETVYQGAQVRYGVINSAFNKFGWINPGFFNKRYGQEDEMPEKAILAVFTPNKARYIGLNDSRLKTTNQTYVVRYAEKGTIFNSATNESYPTIDYDYPIEILRAIPKNCCVRADLSPDHKNLMIVWNADKRSASPAESSETDQGKAGELHNEVPPISEGESVLLLTEKGKLYDYYVKETETEYWLSRYGSISKSEVQQLYRFGLVTDFREGSDATLNGITDFSTSILDPAVYNILRSNAFVQLHIVYAYGNGQISHVRRLTPEEMKLIPFSRGLVTEHSTTARQLVIDHDTIHCISVGTNPLVSNECKTGSIVNRNVYVRRVRHSFFDDGSDQAELMTFAVDIHCASALLTVSYDIGLGSYKATFKTNTAYPLLAPEAFLKPLEGKTELVDVVPNEAGDELVAFIHGQDFSDESVVDEEIASSGMEDAALTALMLDRVKLRSIQFLDISKRDEEGFPANTDYASEALRTLNGRTESEETLVAKYLICERFPDVKIPSDRGGGRVLTRSGWMLRQLRTLYEKKCIRIGQMNTYTCAEYSYLLATLLPFAKQSSRVVGTRRAARAYTKEDCLYRLFLMDFASRDEMQEYNIRNVKPDGKTTVDHLLACGAVNNVQNFIAHLLMVNRVNPEIMADKLAGMNGELFRTVQEYVRGIDSTLVAEDANALIRSLSSKYEQLRSRFIQESTDLSADSNRLLDYLDELGKCFLRLTCEEDARCFDELRSLVGRLVSYRSKPGFTAQEVELTEIYRSLDNLESDILEHPGKESLELLAMNQDGGIIACLKAAASDLLNKMYKATNSFIILEPNFTEISKGQKLIQLILYNGDTQHSFAKTITNINLEIRSLTEEVSVVRTAAPQSLAGGENDEVAVELSIPPAFSGEISLEWTMTYRSGVAFQRGKTVYDTLNYDVKNKKELRIRSEAEKVWNVIDSSFQLVSEISESKNVNADNPYRKPAEGNPLEKRNREMFVGREKEKKSIFETIVRETGGEKRFIQGSTVILYGQRKCGKTSLINIICSDIREDAVLNEQAIIITFSDILTESCGEARFLSEFREGQYCKIISNFADEIHANHPDVERLLLENGVTIPDVDTFLDMSHIRQQNCFDTIFRRFMELDQGRHTVFLIMDEFTRLCTSIADIVEAAPDNSPEKMYADIPSFIRVFSQNYGFVQMIIGHQSMMSALGRLGTLNHTAEFAQKVELHALMPEEAEELIVNPMQRIFGYNVYRTPLGHKAIERLKDLSGCSPTFLMRLCRDVFTYYVEKCPSTQLTDRDIRNVVAEQLNTLTEDDFDIIITEDGDGAGLSKEKKTYKFLFAAAKCSISEGERMADENRIRKELNWDESEYMRIRDILLARHVISLAGYGRIKINNGLFLEYVHKRIN